ncbi:MAG: TonB-dependent receptor, partial [Deltaproteobacteria bacterium]
QSPEHLRASVRAQGRLHRLGYWLSAGLLRRAPFEEALRVGSEAYRLRGLLAYLPTDDLRLELEGGYVDGRGDFFTVLGSGGVRNRWPYLRARLKSDVWDVGAVLDRNETRFDIDARVALPGVGGTDPQPLLATPPILHDTESAELWAKYSHVFAGALRLTAGVGARAIHHLPRTTVRCPPGVPPDAWSPDLCEPNDLLETRLGTFAQGEWRIRPDLTVTGGLRLDLNSLTPEPGISPLLAAVYKVHPDHTLRLTVGRAYRKPVYLETHGHILMEPVDGVPEEVTRRLQYLFAYGIGNPDLKNEKRSSVGLGWRGRFLQGRIKTSVDLFTGLIEDATGLDTSSLRIESFGGVPRIPDDVEVKYRTFERPGYAYGGEATLRVQASEALVLTLFYAFDQSYEYRPAGPDDPDAGGDGWVLQEAESEPDHRATVTLRYRAPTGTVFSLNAHWSSAYVDYVPNPESVVGERTRLVMGDALLVGLHFGHSFSLGGSAVELGLDVYDLLDQRIREQVGTDLPSGENFGAQPIRRRLTLYLRGRY